MTELLPTMFLAVAIGATAGATPRAVERGPADLPPQILQASAYVVDYLRGLSAIVSEEKYEQRLERSRVASGGFGALGRETELTKRTLVSDFLLVQLPGTTSWQAFRDVYAVEGVTIRDRDNRLEKLFIQPHADRIAQADRIREESSRYNIGSGVRDFFSSRRCASGSRSASSEPSALTTTPWRCSPSRNPRTPPSSGVRTTRMCRSPGRSGSNPAPAPC
jgi:hypothetical protein